MTISTLPVCFVGSFVGWLLNVPNAYVSEGRNCLNNHFMCCHTEVEVANQTCFQIQSQYTDTGPTRPMTDAVRLGTWQVATRVPISSH